MSSLTEQAIDLRHVLGILRRTFWIIPLTALVFGAIGFFWSAQQPTRYSSVAQILVEPVRAFSTDPTGSTSITRRELLTVVELADSELVLETALAAMEDQGISTRGVEVSASLLGDTEIIEIRSTGPTAVTAQSAARETAIAYLEFRRGQATELVSEALRALAAREEQLVQRLDEIAQEVATANESEQRTLSLERDRINTILAGLSGQRAALLAADITGGGYQLADARLPRRPFQPNPRRNTVLFLVLGTVVGFILALLRDRLDERIHDERQATEAVDAPVVGTVPTWQDGQDVASIAEPLSPEAESYRMLRTNFRFAAVGTRTSSVIVTSARPGEGKTLTAANLAVSLARSGLRVVLVDADLRRPMVHAAFDIELTPGLSQLLLGDVATQEVAYDVGVPNLRVIPAGQIPPNPAELLASRTMRDLVGQLSDHADIVIYDTPPVLSVADPLELAPVVGVAMLVVDVRHTGANVLRQAAARLRAVGSRPLGVVLNHTSPRDRLEVYGYYAPDRTPAPDHADPSPRPMADTAPAPVVEASAAGSTDQSFVSRPTRTGERPPLFRPGSAPSAAEGRRADPAGPEVRR